MKGGERRQRILDELRAAIGPLAGGALGRIVGVSRQAVVQDIALLRADGHDIVATSSGYVLRAGEGPSLPTRLVKVHHGIDDLSEELTAIVDLGGTVMNVIVNHRVYGKITADLDIRNRRDIARYLEGIRTGRSYPLMTVTSGYHFHRIAAATVAELDEIEAALAARGFLAEVFPYERDGIS